MFAFNDGIEQIRIDFEQALLECIPQDVSSPLKESMIYALSGGGKRLRPLLFLSQVPPQKIGDISVRKFACAIEILHNYTLVHDDLPCMDNDDYRRGKLTVHKMFGETVAVLCGDALLNLAYECIAQALSACKAGELPILVQAVVRFSELCGASGLLSGQVRDLDGEVWTEEKLSDVYEKKTCNLFMAAAECGAILCKNDQENAREFGYAFGFLFQLADDLADTESDVGALPVYGKDKTRELFYFYKNRAEIAAKTLNNSEFLLNIIEKTEESIS